MFVVGNAFLLVVIFIYMKNFSWTPYYIVLSAVPMLKRPTITDYQSAESEQLMKRLRPGGHGVDEVILPLNSEVRQFHNLCELLIILHAYAGNLSRTHFPTSMVSG
jgi:hypothetical protein